LFCYNASIYKLIFEHAIDIVLEGEDAVIMAESKNYAPENINIKNGKRIT